MRAGTLDTRVAFQRKSVTHSPSGTPVEIWSTLINRWAAVNPVTGDERNAAQQWIAREQSEFTIRWSPEANDITPLDRVVCPAEDTGFSPVPYRSIYDIISVHEEKRRVNLVIKAARRVA